MEEIRLVRIGKGPQALRKYKSQWDTFIEKLTQTGEETDHDRENLYSAFKASFVEAPELAEHVSKMRRSACSSRVHT